MLRSLLLLMLSLALCWLPLQGRAAGGDWHLPGHELSHEHQAHDEQEAAHAQADADCGDCQHGCHGHTPVLLMPGTSVPRAQTGDLQAVGKFASRADPPPTRPERPNWA